MISPNALHQLEPALDALWPGTPPGGWHFVLAASAGDNRSDAKVTVFAFRAPPASGSPRAQAQPACALKTSLSADYTWLDKQFFMLEHLERVQLKGVSVPRPLGILEHGGQRFYAESFVWGRPAAYRPAQLHAVVAWASEWILDLHLSSQAKTDHTALQLRGQLDGWVRVVAGARCLEQDAAQAAHTVARAAYEWAEQLPAVLAHGDFHPNQFLATGQAKVTGITDWEHACLAGWPALDMIELLVTSACLEGRYATKLQACDALFMSARHAPSPEASALTGYMDRLGIAPDSLKSLLGVYSLHTLAQTLALRGDILPIPAIVDKYELLLRRC